MSDFVFITVCNKYNKSYSLGVFSGQCNSPLGLEDKSIPDTDLTASSVYGIYYGPERARLNTVRSGSYKGAWSPRYAYRGEWIQDFAGNNDKHSLVTHQFIKPLYARLVRIIALAWYSFPSMRLELYGCREGDLKVYYFLAILDGSIAPYT
ncbi:hypothetical protein pdam_00007201 [Pocillopora damicornis]|uniref:F5/8 type C domain-containing protein n=1 Tax=Pocillopora damicornis TaxID=46731 RepID=A0A3M6USL3_POCDA|nr:hypothetical protein pdam_00007201 [Pocillopora damicornis]